MSRIDDIPDEALNCRTVIGHNWRPFTVKVEGTRSRPIFHETLRCPACGTKRIMVLDHRGVYLTQPRYTYDKEYRYRVEGGRLTAEERASLRVRAIWSHLPPEDHPKPRKPRKPRKSDNT